MKKYISLPYHLTETCRLAYSHTVLPENIICAGGESGVDTCRGDSGGPLTLRVEGRVQLWGITDAGNPHCGKIGFPGVYTSVLPYLYWLEQNMKV